MMRALSFPRLLVACVSAACVAAMALSSPVLAVDPDEQLADPVLEARARAVSKTLRCVVCQSQSIDDSNASLAKDLRIIVRERIAAGDTNAQVTAYVVERYGDYVLLAPPLRGRTLLLWAAPLLFLLVGGGVAVVVIRQAGGFGDDDDGDNQGSGAWS